MDNTAEFYSRGALNNHVSRDERSSRSPNKTRANKLDVSTLKGFLVNTNAIFPSFSALSHSRAVVITFTTVCAHPGANTADTS
jgi:hypothetical protein